MRIPTMKVKRGEQVVIINVADFDPKVDTKIQDTKTTTPVKRARVRK